MAEKEKMQMKKQNYKKDKLQQKQQKLDSIPNTIRNTTNDYLRKRMPNTSLDNAHKGGLNNLLLEEPTIILNTKPVARQKVTSNKTSLKRQVYNHMKCYYKIPLFYLSQIFDETQSNQPNIKLVGCQCEITKVLFYQIVKDKCILCGCDNKFRAIFLKNNTSICKECLANYKQFQKQKQKKKLSKELEQHKQSFQYIQSILYTCMACGEFIGNLNYQQDTFNNQDLIVCRLCYLKNQQDQSMRLRQRIKSPKKQNISLQVQPQAQIKIDKQKENYKYQKLQRYQMPNQRLKHQIIQKRGERNRFLNQKPPRNLQYNFIKQDTSYCNEEFETYQKIYQQKKGKIIKNQQIKLKEQMNFKNQNNFKDQQKKIRLKEKPKQQRADIKMQEKNNKAQQKITQNKEKINQTEINNNQCETINIKVQEKKNKVNIKNQTKENISKQMSNKKMNKQQQGKIQEYEIKKEGKKNEKQEKLNQTLETTTNLSNFSIEQDSFIYEKIEIFRKKIQSLESKVNQNSKIARQQQNKKLLQAQKKQEYQQQLWNKNQKILKDFENQYSLMNNKVRIIIEQFQEMKNVNHQNDLVNQKEELIKMNDELLRKNNDLLNKNNDLLSQNVNLKALSHEKDCKFNKLSNQFIQFKNQMKNQLMKIALTNAKKNKINPEILNQQEIQNPINYSLQNDIQHKSSILLLKQCINNEIEACTNEQFAKVKQQNVKSNIFSFGLSSQEQEDLLRQPMLNSYKIVKIGKVQNDKNSWEESSNHLEQKSYQQEEAGRKIRNIAVPQTSMTQVPKKKK